MPETCIAFNGHQGAILLEQQDGENNQIKASQASLTTGQSWRFNFDANHKN